MLLRSAKNSVVHYEAVGVAIGVATFCMSANVIMSPTGNGI